MLEQGEARTWQFDEMWIGSDGCYGLGWLYGDARAAGVKEWGAEEGKEGGRRREKGSGTGACRVCERERGTARSLCVYVGVGVGVGVGVLVCLCVFVCVSVCLCVSVCPYVRVCLCVYSLTPRYLHSDSADLSKRLHTLFQAVEGPGGSGGGERG